MRIEVIPNSRLRRGTVVCALSLCLFLLGATAAKFQGMGTREMTVAEAVKGLRTAETPNQRKLAAAALRRQAIAALAALRDAARCEDAGGAEARTAIEHLREELRR